MRGRPPRILMLAPDVASVTGGIAMVTQSLLRHLGGRAKQNELALKVLSLRDPADEAESQRLSAWVGEPRCFTHGNGPMAFSLRALRESLVWADVVLSMHLGLSRLAPLIPSALRPTWITFLYGIEAWSRLHGTRKRALQMSDSIVAISLHTLRKCKAENPWLHGGAVCHLGVEDVSARSEVDLQGHLGFSPRATDILVVGRMARGEGLKGHEQLIQALPKVNQAERSARLIIVGGGDDIERYRDLARRSPVSDKILFPGRVDAAHLQALYENCGVFAMPSRQEGFGLVYLEAMRAGLPCVASTSDAASEVVVDEVTGLLVEPNDRHALANALTRLLSDQNLRVTLGKNGRARFLAEFTEAHFHRRFSALLNQSLETHSMAARPA